MKAIVDCNSFYAACERLFQPSLLGKPVVVLSNNDGCIISRTDEAKALGIPMAGPYFASKKTLDEHQVAVFSSNYHLYGDMSRRVMETLRCLAPSVEVYSVDESFLDLEGIDETNLLDYARQVKQTTEMWTGIPVSIGIAPTKVLSKVANRLAKKDKKGSGGIVILHTAAEQQEALQMTAVEDVWGVGNASLKKLALFNVNTAWELRNRTEEWARKHLGGVVGARLVRELQGEPCIGMKDPLETKKMICTSRMFGKPVFGKTELREAVATYTARVAEKLRRQHSVARVITIFLVANNMAGNYTYKPSTSSRSATLPFATSLTNLLIAHALPLVDQLFCNGTKYLKAGVVVSDIIGEEAVQTNLFSDPAAWHYRDLMESVDNLNFSMRKDIIWFGSAGSNRHWKMKQEFRSRKFTSSWNEMAEVR